MSASSWPAQGKMTGGSSREQHLGFKPVDTSKTEDALRAAERACQLAIQQIPQEVEVSQALLIYPEGERDAVTITERDMAELQPGKFLGDTIVDFYIKYLQRGLPPERGKLFYFFNSFFFTKLLQSTASTRIDPCKVDYEQLRKWTEEVNLFEKDYVFIPIVKSSHWSLVIICNLGSLTRAHDEMTRFPCIVHLDSIEGHHESFEGLIRSYVLQAWMERFQPSIDRDQLLALYQMKYVQAKVPQQYNSHDCEEVLAKRRHIQNLILELSGIFQEHGRKHKAIKHLIQELMQTSQRLRAYLENGGDNEPFNYPQIGHMEQESRSESLSSKQQHGELEVKSVSPTHFNGQIFEATYASSHEDSIDVQHQQSNGISRLDYEPLDGLEPQHGDNQRVIESFSDKLHHLEPKEVPYMNLSEILKGKNKRGRNMTKEETSVLLSCKLEGGCFCKGSGGATHWNLISEEIGKKLGSLPSADQCRLWYDSLLKAYKSYKMYCIKTGKAFSEVTEEERFDLKLATTLSEEWYTRIDEICNEANISKKRMKVVLARACGIVHGTLRNVIPTSVLSFFNEDLQSTLLNLVQYCSLGNWSMMGNAIHFDLEDACQMLTILQDREQKEILNYVLKLWELKLVSVVGMDFEGQDLAHLDLCKSQTWYVESRLLKKIKKVLCKNPHLETFCNSFPVKESSLQYIKVLNLSGCMELKHLDLTKFPNLQDLYIWCCSKLNLITGWKVATSLASIVISNCMSYHDFPDIRYLSSLIQMRVRKENQWNFRPDFRKTPPLWQWQWSQFNIQCAKLQRLEIFEDKSSTDIVDFKNLKGLEFLELLSLGGCTFSKIQSLSELQTLTTLHFRCWRFLKSVPELGFLKGLTHLDMSHSCIEEVFGVGQLHLLTFLDLHGCKFLKWLPFLGHLRALVYLNLKETGVKKILGREDLISLETLLWDIE